MNNGNSLNKTFFSVKKLLKLRIFYRIQKLVSTMHLVSIYKTFVQPTLQYGLLAHAFTKKTKRDFLDFIEGKRLFLNILRARQYQSIQNQKPKKIWFSGEELHLHELLKTVFKFSGCGSPIQFFQFLNALITDIDINELF